MNKSEHKNWLPGVLIVGATYCVIGILFGAFANRSTSQQMVVAWRVASFVISLIAFALHISYEHFRLGNRILRNGLHTSLAVALGGFLLAVAANVHSLGVDNASHRLLALALLIWPVMTGIPAFVVALIVAGGLSLIERSSLRDTPVS